MNRLARSFVAVSLVSLALPASGQALRLVASGDLADLNVPATGVAVPVEFSEITDPVTGFGVVGLFTLVAGDTGGGTGPWALDVSLEATSPGGDSGVFTPIGGDVTIADYPLADGARPFTPPTDANGTWTFTFDTTAFPSNWVYGLRDVSVHLLADAAEVTQTYDATPDPATSWNRPFFIDGVSGLGPVSFDAFQFEVTESGVYDLTSVLSSGRDHFSFLYKGSFDPSLPLENLQDYGLGNGNSPFGIPRGTSFISQLLFEGETYVWVTSQWASFRPIEATSNTIVGPGDAVAPTDDCPADTNGDGELTPADFNAWVIAFNAQAAECDQNGDGGCDPADFNAWVINFNAGCP
ncbi:MAG: GC-type dockerin domain-anchored protein [Planctomycetota bacterium]